MQFPMDEQGFGVEDQVYLGDTGILFHPVVKPGADSVEVYIAESEVLSLSRSLTQTYYDYFDYTPYKGKGHHNVPAPLNKIPVLVRGGSILPRKDRIRGSSARMTRDPYTLFVTLSDNQTAEGELYIDDGETFEYQKGAYVHRKFVLEDKVLSSKRMGKRLKAGNTFAKSLGDIRIERIIIVGVPKKFTGKNVKVLQGKGKWDVPVIYEPAVKGKAQSIVIRDPKVLVGRDWTIHL
jgi:mannosyl-oligosaccharide alpha-1,3-glucosidase